MNDEQRSDALEKRRALVQACADYCAPVEKGEVLPSLASA